MLRFALLTTIGAVLGAFGSFAIGASSSSVSTADTRAIYKAVGLTERAGKLINACDEIVQPELEAVDLNSDGQPEVFVTVLGSCQGGAAGAELSLLIKSKGHWKVNLGFPASGYKLLTTRNKGFPDIEIEGPGFCFPVWRWNGSQYAIYKRCDR
ncbi:MAG: hypothetical protein HYU78_11420 [Rhodocyclales bacterium]|nr:hypothetical protein [Rhodocyclales bacterium]